MGRIRDVLRLPLVSAGQPRRARHSSSALQDRRCRRCLRLAATLARQRSSAYRGRSAGGRGVGCAGGVRRAQGGAQRGNRSRRRARSRRHLARQYLGQGRHPARLPARAAGAGGDRRTLPVLRQGHLSVAAGRRRRRHPDRAGRLRRFATAATSRAASSACRRCGSMSAHTSTKARWWTAMPWSAAAPRSAGGYISPPRHRSAGCSSRPARCRSSSRTTCWSVATAGCTRERSCASARCWQPGTILTGGTAGIRPGARPGLPPRRRPAARDPRRARSWCRVPGRCEAGPGREAGIALYTPVIVKYRDEKTDTAVRLEELLR